MSDESATWNIPLWFVRLAAGILTLAVPWAGWVTIQLTTINVRLESTAELRRHVERLQEQVAAHVTDPEIHLSGLRQLQRRMDQVEQRLEKK